MTYARKTTSIGLIEICDSSMPGWYTLLINGKIYKQSQDYSFIKSMFDSY